MNEIEEQKNKFKEELSQHILSLLDDEWFRELYFSASTETFEFNCAIQDTLFKYAPCFNDSLSKLFNFKQVGNIIAHNIYRGIIQELNELLNNGDMKFENGSWIFSKKSYTKKSICKKIVENVLHSKYTKKDDPIFIPHFNNECHNYDEEDNNRRIINFT
jgi:hypothetical protein